MRRLALVLCAVAGLGLLLFPTAGTPAAQQAVDTDDVSLSSAPAPHGAYVTQVDGEVRLDFTRRHPKTGERIGLNDRAVTRFDRVLQVTYTESGPARVWFETPTTGVYFYHGDPSQAVDSREEAIRMAGGEAVYVGVVIDTTDPESRIGQFDKFEIHVGTPGSDSEDSEEVQVGTPPANGPDEGEGPSEPEPEPNPPADDGQDGSPESGPSPEPPEGPLPDLDPGGDDPAELPESGTTDGNPPPELGETPDSTQIALGGLGWVLLLVAGVLLGTAAAAVLRRRSV